MLRDKAAYQTPIVAKESKPTSPQKAPKAVRSDVLIESGMLLSAKHIADLKKLNLPKGRYHRREINALLEKHHITDWTCPYSIIRGNGMPSESDALYAIYRDAVEDKPSIIGKGLTSKVKDIQNLDTGTWSVLKVLSNYDKIAEHEHKLLTKLNKADSHLIEKDSKKKVHKREIVMKRANGVELYKLIVDKQLPTDSMLLKKIALNILIELKALHDQGILIRDLKQKNIIVDPITTEATIIDFGFAIEAINGRASDHTRCGTIPYIAPEIYYYPQNHTYTIATDIYAASLVLRSLLTGETRCYDSEEDEYYDVYDGIHRIEKRGGLEFPYIVEQDIKNLYRRMYHDDPTKRPGLVEACDILARHIHNEQPVKVLSTSDQGLFKNTQTKSSKASHDDDSMELYLKTKNFTL